MKCRRKSYEDFGFLSTKNRVLEWLRINTPTCCNEDMTCLQEKVTEKLSTIKPPSSDVELPTPSNPSSENYEDKMERVNRLIPPELHMPPVTDADLAELARDIQSLGHMSGERTTVLKHESDNHNTHTGQSAYLYVCLPYVKRHLFYK